MRRPGEIGRRRTRAYNGKAMPRYKKNEKISGWRGLKIKDRHDTK
jgi:hypothetical protein